MQRRHGRKPARSAAAGVAWNRHFAGFAFHLRKIERSRFRDRLAGQHLEFFPGHVADLDGGAGRSLKQARAQIEFHRSITGVMPDDRDRPRFAAEYGLRPGVRDDFEPPERRRGAEVGQGQQNDPFPSRWQAGVGIAAGG